MTRTWWPPNRWRITAIVTKAVKSWGEHRTIRFGAGLAYYWLFALVPLTLSAVTLAGFLFPTEEVLAYIFNVLQNAEASDSFVEVEELITGWVEGAASAPVGIAGGVVAVVTASFALTATQDALNVVWGVARSIGMRAAVRRRVLSLLAAILVSSVLVVLLLTSAILSGIELLVPDWLGVGELVTDLAGIAAPVAVGYGLVVLLYRTLPDAAVPWKAALISGGVVTVGLVIGTRGFWWYLSGWSSPTLAGAAEAAFALLAWMYVVAQIFLAGVELCRAIAVEGVEDVVTADALTAMTSLDAAPQGAAPVQK